MDTKTEMIEPTELEVALKRISELEGRIEKLETRIRTLINYIDDEIRPGGIDDDIKFRRVQSGYSDY